MKLARKDLSGRNNYGVPNLIENSKPFSKKIELTIDSIISIKKIVSIKPGEKLFFDFIICVSEDRNYVLENMKKYLNRENNSRVFELSKARIEAENRYLNITGKEIGLYQKLLTCILNNVNQYTNLKMQNFEIYPVTELWKYGISGDLPIIFVKIKNVNDIDLIEELVKAYEYFKNKNFYFDLVILNEEKENYDCFVREAIHNVIWNKNISHMLNAKGGIFVLNNIKNEDKKLLTMYAKLTFDARNGGLEYQLNDIEENTIKIEKNYMNQIEPAAEEDHNEINIDDLKFYNEIGGFSQDGKEYQIRINKNNKTPMPWCNILANDNFGTLISESLGGYSWYKNCRLNRISSWSNNPILDVPSEVIYLKDEESKKMWSLGYNPMHDNNDYSVTHGFGYTKIAHSCLRNKTGNRYICAN